MKIERRGAIEAEFWVEEKLEDFGEDDTRRVAVFGCARDDWVVARMNALGETIILKTASFAATNLSKW